MLGNIKLGKFIILGKKRESKLRGVGGNLQNIAAFSSTIDTLWTSNLHTFIICVAKKKVKVSS